MKTAFVFPGQGSQFVGMGKGFAESHLDEANRILGFDLKKLCFEGPEEELKRTEITQPAILTVSVAALQLLKEKPDAVAGHSLGEYSALVAAGSISFADAVKIVHLRGKFMQAAVPAGEGAMAAVLMPPKDKIREICEQVGDVQPANLNSPDQIVISGKKEAVEEAGKRLKEAGAKRIIPLAVSAPFHSRLMEPAAKKLEAELAKITISDAKVPVVANVTADYVASAEKIRELLIRQVTGSVLWEYSVRKMIADGVGRFVEVGPGKVLCGLIKKIDPAVEARTYDEVKG
ncbi:MAG TPA: ACP S-malonyltransferase [Candidatus Omnitrophota bacterium]|nr:ACP S-malonyltransferase [Candidatus Omnitrophota bacterium]